MKSVLVLGGAGGVGRYAVRVLRDDPVVDRIVVADRDLELCTAFCREQGPKVVPLALDVSDPSALVAAMHDTDLVMSCVGPFFRFGVAVLSAAIEAGRSYVDICDDPEPTLAMLELDARARERGISALVGMGITPGVSNLLAVLAARELDETLELVTGWDLAAALPETIGPEPSAATLHGVEQLSGHIRVFREESSSTSRPSTSASSTSRASVDAKPTPSVIPSRSRFRARSRASARAGTSSPPTRHRRRAACAPVLRRPRDPRRAHRRAVGGALRRPRRQDPSPRRSPRRRPSTRHDVAAADLRVGPRSPRWAAGFGARDARLRTGRRARWHDRRSAGGRRRHDAARRDRAMRRVRTRGGRGPDPIPRSARPALRSPRASCAGLAVTVRSWESTRLLEALAVQLEASSGLDRKP